MNGMEWSVMELIPSNTTHLTNFPFPPIWGVSNGMEHINKTITTLSLLSFPNFIYVASFPRFFLFTILYSILLLLFTSTFPSLVCSSSLFVLEIWNAFCSLSRNMCYLKTILIFKFQGICYERRILQLIIATADSILMFDFKLHSLQTCNFHVLHYNYLENVN